MSGEQTYPDSWQSCDCPPKDSIYPDGRYFRAVPNNPATKDDFLNSIEADKFHNASHCDRLAVSMLGTWNGAAHHLRLFSFKSDWFIATVQLDKTHGKVKRTPNKKQPTHVDWWPYPSVDRHNTVINIGKP